LIFKQKSNRIVDVRSTGIIIKKENLFRLDNRILCLVVYCKLAILEAKISFVNIMNQKIKDKLIYFIFRLKYSFFRSNLLIRYTLFKLFKQISKILIML